MPCWFVCVGLFDVDVGAVAFEVGASVGAMFGVVAGVVGGVVDGVLVAMADPESPGGEAQAPAARQTNTAVAARTADPDKRRINGAPTTVTERCRVQTLALSKQAGPILATVLTEPPRV